MCSWRNTHAVVSLGLVVGDVCVVLMSGPLARRHCVMR